MARPHLTQDARTSRKMWGGAPEPRTKSDGADAGERSEREERPRPRMRLQPGVAAPPTGPGAEVAFRAALLPPGGEQRSLGAAGRGDGGPLQRRQPSEQGVHQPGEERLAEGDRPAGAACPQVPNRVLRRVEHTVGHDGGPVDRGWPLGLDVQVVRQTALRAARPHREQSAALHS